jgi:hypothetical protein
MSTVIKPPAAPAGPAPLPWPAAIIVVVVVLAATALFLTGHTAAAALGLVGGAGLAGVEVVQRLALALRSGR